MGFYATEPGGLLSISPVLTVSVNSKLGTWGIHRDKHESSITKYGFRNNFRRVPKPQAADNMQVS